MIQNEEDSGKRNGFFLGGGWLNLIYNDGNVYDRFNDLILTEYR